MKAFYSRSRGRHDGSSCLILFTPEGIVICATAHRPGRDAGRCTASGTALTGSRRNSTRTTCGAEVLDNKNGVPEYAADYCRKDGEGAAPGKQGRSLRFERYPEVKASDETGPDNLEQ